ncbi:MAG: PQQ-binding-like beta-propeller repeat protein [Thermoanaerobaculia bacterium]|nr:PQQ-binding-like beta-propeller repeat protein [Thermoanaerobaculia bacterium]
MKVSDDSPFLLGDWTVRPRENCIVREGETSNLEPKLMEVLVFLASEPSRIHLRQEILDSVWRDTFITDEVLTNAVWELRRALGDHAREPQYIKTIPRKGYGLVAPVEPFEAATDMGGVESSIPPEQDAVFDPPRKLLRPLLGLVVAMLLVGMFWWVRGGRVAEDSSWPHSIVVLPIEALSDDPVHQLFADALTDTLTAELAASGEFGVSSRSTVFELARAGLPATEIARQLGAEAFLEGTLSFSPTGRARLSSQLIDRRRDRHLWAGVLEDDVRDSLGAERRLSRRITLNLVHADPRRDTPSADLDKVPSPLQDEGEGWRVRTGGEVWSDPTPFEAGLLVGSDDHYLYALESGTGAELWRYQAPGAVRDAVQVAGAVAYLATYDYAAAIDTTTGSELWRRRLPLTSPLAYSWVGPETLVVGSFDQHVYGLDPRDGETRWRVSTEGEAHVPISVAENRALVGTDRGEVILIDLATGRAETRVAVDSAVAGVALTAEGDSFVATSRGFLYRLARDGTERWRRSLESRLGIAPLLHHGVLYQGTGDGRILALDAVDGTLLWTFTARDAIGSRPTIDGDRLFVGSLDQNLYAIDLVSGTELWHFPTGGWVVDRPLLLDGLLIFASLDGVIYALPSSGPATRFDPAEWPDPGAPRLVASGTGPKLLWKREIHSPTRVRFADGNLFVTTEDSVLAFDAERGDPLWTVAVADGFASAPVFATDRVVAGSRQGTLRALDPQSGAELWRSQLGAETSALPVASGDRIYLGDRLGRLNAIDRQSGELLWSTLTELFINGGALILKDRVVVGSCGESIWALGIPNGKALWKTHAGECVVSDGVGFGNTAIFGTSHGDLLAVDVDTGARRWTFNTGGEDIWYRPLVMENRVFFGSGDYNVYSLDAATGRELWRFHTANRALTEIATYAELVLFGSHDRHLYAVERDSGEERWRLETTRRVEFLLVVGDRLYFLGDDKYLFAYRL